jgi:hypothetical protein
MPTSRTYLAALCLAILLAFASLPRDASAQATCSTPETCGTVTCMTSGTIKTCQRTALLAGNVTNVQTLLANNANCSGGANGGSATLVATAMTNAPTPRTCSFLINQVAANDCTCAITSADGLPVELLDFSIEGTESAGHAPADRALESPEIP